MKPKPVRTVLALIAVACAPLGLFYAARTLSQHREGLMRPSEGGAAAPIIEVLQLQLQSAIKRQDIAGGEYAIADQGVHETNDQINALQLSAEQANEQVDHAKCLQETTETIFLETSSNEAAHAESLAPMGVQTSGNTQAAGSDALRALDAVESTAFNAHQRLAQCGKQLPILEAQRNEALQRRQNATHELEVAMNDVQQCRSKIEEATQSTQ